MVRFSLVAVAAAAVNAAQVSLLSKRLPDTGMMPKRGRHEFTNDRGELDLGAIMDTSNAIDKNKYPGEDEEREIANDAVLHWKNGDRPHHVVEVGQSERLDHSEWYKSS